MHKKAKKELQNEKEYDPRKKMEHIDMVPLPGEIVEPLTGSSVIIEPSDEPEVPDNGFPIGYGPNEHLKRPEAPKKPKFRERMRRSVQKLTKKQKIKIFLFTFLLGGSIAGVIIYVTVSGVFRTDYADTYAQAKELRTAMQYLRSDASCSKVIDYINNPYTTMQVYQSYIESCKGVGAGVESSLVEALGNTEGVLKNEKISRKYDTFKNAMDSARNGNANVDAILDLYLVWHDWIIAENKGDNDHANWNWTEDDIDTAVDILLQSGNDGMAEYGEDWKEKKLAATTATQVCLYPENPADGCSTEDREAMEEARSEFTKWKKENEYKITKKLPLDMVDTAKLYEKFQALYEEIRLAYQENYNYEKGGCKEFVGSVVCD